MREYIIYAIVIFLPLGFLMAYFLYRQGLNKINIACFITAALVSVIIFPICAARAGTVLTGLIFIFILGLFSWGIVSASGGKIVENTDAKSSEPEEVSVNLAVDETEPETIGSAAENEMSASIESSETEEQTAESLKQPHNIIEGQPEQADQVESAIQYITSGEVQNESAEKSGEVVTENAELDSRQQMEMAAAISAPAVCSDESGSDKLTPVETETGTRDSEPEPESKIEVEKQAAKEETATAEEVVVEVEDTKAKAAAIEEEQEISDDTAEMTPTESIDQEEFKEQELNEEEINRSVAEKSEGDKQDQIIGQTAADTTEIQNDGSNTAGINSMLDAGFENKINGNLPQAVLCFISALNLTNSPELKYLLSQEIVINYEIMGQYNKAINIINDAIGSGIVPTAELNQAQQKCDYLKNMVQELERLGLGEVPISEVPRMIKMKVGQNYTISEGSM